MSALKEFQKEKNTNIAKLGSNTNLHEIAKNFIAETAEYKYSYNFNWLGIPIIQFPQDMIAMQEIIWTIQPDLVVETGIAHGGSLIFYASLLNLIGKGHVLGIDIDIRSHNRQIIEKHPMFKHITLIEGSSTSDDIIKQVDDIAKNKQTVLVCLDSNHTHDHVLEELKLYSSFVSKDSYLVVFDTIIEDMPSKFSSQRPWDKGNNPRTAVKEFLKNNDDFIVDEEITNKLLITASPGGYLKRVKT